LRSKWFPDGTRHVDALRMKTVPRPPAKQNTLWGAGLADAAFYCSIFSAFLPQFSAKTGLGAKK